MSLLLGRSSGTPALEWDLQFQVSRPPSCRIRVAVDPSFIGSLSLGQRYSVYASVKERGNEASFEVFSGILLGWEVDEAVDGITVVLTLAHPVWERLQRYVPLEPVVYAGIDDRTRSASTAVSVIRDVLARVGVYGDIRLPDTPLGSTVTWSNQDALSLIGRILGGAGYTLTSKYYADVVVEGGGVRVYERQSVPVSAEIPYSRVLARRVSVMESDSSKMFVMDPDVLSSPTPPPLVHPSFYPPVLVGGSVPVVESVDPTKEVGDKRCDDRFLDNPRDPVYDWNPKQGDDWPDEDYSDRDRGDSAGSPRNARYADEDCLSPQRDVYIREAVETSEQLRRAIQQRETVQTFANCLLMREVIKEYTEVHEASGTWSVRVDHTQIYYEYEEFDMGDRDRPVLKLSRKLERTVSEKHTSDECAAGWPLLYREKEETWRYAYSEGELYPEYHRVVEWSPAEENWKCGESLPSATVRRVEYDWVTKTGDQLIRRSVIQTYDADGFPDRTVYSSQTSLGDWVGRGRLRREIRREAVRVVSLEQSRKAGDVAVPKGRGARMPGLSADGSVVFPDTAMSTMHLPGVAGTDRWLYAGTIAVSKNKSVVRTPCEPPVTSNDRVVYKPLVSGLDDAGLPEGEHPALTISLPLVGSQSWLDTLRSRVLEEMRLKILVADVELLPTPSVVPGIRVVLPGDVLYGGVSWYVSEVQWSWREGQLSQRVVMMAWM